MDKDKKMYTVSLGNFNEDIYIMVLTDDQVKVFKWLIKQGYDITILEQGDVITL